MCDMGMRWARDEGRVVILGHSGTVMEEQIYRLRPEIDLVCIHGVGRCLKAPRI